MNLSRLLITTDLLGHTTWTNKLSSITLFEGKRRCVMNAVVRTPRHKKSLRCIGSGKSAQQENLPHLSAQPRVGCLDFPRFERAKFSDNLAGSIVTRESQV